MNIQELNLQELNYSEKVETTGGLFGIFLLGLIIGWIVAGGEVQQV